MVRALAATLLITCAALAPLPAALRIPLLGGMGGYLLLTALSGTCLGYRLLGKSTCAVGPR